MGADELFNLLHDVLAEYHEAHDLRKLPIKVDGLIPILTRRTALDDVLIESYDLPNGLVGETSKSPQIFGRVLTYKNGGRIFARIQVPSFLTLPFRRLAVCKELWQCVLDQDPVTRVGDIRTLVSLGQWLIADSALQVEGFAPGATEQWAELLAVETLFPYELRSQSQFMDRYDAEEIFASDMAETFKIPIEYVSDGLAAHYFSWVGQNRTKLVKLG